MATVESDDMFVQAVQTAFGTAPQTATTDARQRIPLDGEWSFQFGDEPPQSITVPAPWESARPDLRNVAGTAVYERTFTLPESFAGRQLSLKFGAVDYYAEVWIDGGMVGAHEGGYTPFEFRINEALADSAPGSTHTVRVQVTDSTTEQDAILPDGETLSFSEIPHGKQSWYSSVGGIWQSVSIEARAPTTIGETAFLPDIDAGTVTLQAEFEGMWRAEAGEWQVRVSITPPEAEDAATFTVPIETDTGGRSPSIRAAFPISNPKLWSPEEPHLYCAVITLERDGEMMDVVSRRFGMRKINTRDGRVMLNNKPYFIMGVLDQAFYPRTIYTPPSDAFLRDQFLKAKAMGVNLMRCHIKVPTESYLNLCDEIGLLVWYEIPNGKTLTTDFRERARETLEAMWSRDASHPCIVAVSLINEAWGIDLSDAEQRDWLAETYLWAKLEVSGWLVIDNSPCNSNFHMISDLDDYHIYFSIPDHAAVYAAWIDRFVRRDAGTYSPHGDAEYKRTEPLLLSEFGNWGLPHLTDILEAEGGTPPYWFTTGDGPTRPEGVLERFEQQSLGSIYRDYDDLADSSQEQEWVSLKWEIEEMRRHPELAGYVITEFTDVNWECNGLLGMGREPKIFHDRLKHLQAQDILIPRLMPRTALWEGESASLAVTFSCFSGIDIAGGSVRWSVDGYPELDGKASALASDSAEKYGSYAVANIALKAPASSVPTKRSVHIILEDSQGCEVAQTDQGIVFVPAAMRHRGDGKTVWLRDPEGSSTGLSGRLEGVGFRVVTAPEPGVQCLATRWDATVEEFLQAGGAALIVANSADSIALEDAPGVKLVDRDQNGWWGDWCSTQIWFSPAQFPSLPDTTRFDFEYQHIVPRHVLTEIPAMEVSAGLFAGWLHNPAALAAQLTHGSGKMVITTFDLLPHIGADPIATLLLHDLFAMI